jgi:hypothetical protein
VIGVIPKVDQRVVVREFFELFKTPWEFYEAGRAYDVVIATVDDVPSIDAPVLIVYGNEMKSIDLAIGFSGGPRRAGASVNCDGGSVPIYGSLLTFKKDSAGTVQASADAGIAGLRFDTAASTVIRLGYDLFEEVRFLLMAGQPVERAHVPTLDLHIRMLRRFILNTGAPLIEIPPVPAGHDFTVCLTHDIDFMGIRRHFLDHTMWGFLYRSTFGALRRLLRGRMPVARLFRMWRAAVSLPFVYLGWARDFWDPIPWYLEVEKQLPATYFLIPFKGRAGEHVPGAHPARRATAYDVTDIPDWTTTLAKNGCEVGVHGIDAWHDVETGRAELARITSLTGEPSAGVRMHWLLNDKETASRLQSAGYSYDASAGYNETVGYRNGTTQAFRPLTTSTLLELPLHIQDGALFYPHNLDLSDAEANQRCGSLIDQVRDLGGVLTVLWHDRSHGPERFWGDFYISLIQRLRSSNAWFATASQAVGWFRARRHVRFERLDDARGSRVRILYDGQAIHPPLILRQHEAASSEDAPWNGISSIEPDSPLRVAC